MGERILSDRKKEIMIDKAVIEKVAQEVVRLREECAQLHDEVRAVLYTDGIQEQLAYVYTEKFQKTSSSVDVSKDGQILVTFYKDDAGFWYCFVDGNHRTSQEYPVQSVSEIVKDFMDSYESRSEEQQIAALRGMLDREYSNIADYRKFKAERQGAIVEGINDLFRRIKASRVAAIDKLFADYGIK